MIRGDSRWPPYVNPSNRPPPDRDKIRRVRYDKGCQRADRDKTRRVPDVKGCPTYQDKTPQDSRIISGSRGGVPRDKGCVNQNGLRKGVLDIGYLGIRACARMRTQYSFGDKHARARMAGTYGFCAKRELARIAETHEWPARQTQRLGRICRRRNFLPLC